MSEPDFTIRLQPKQQQLWDLWDAPRTPRRIGFGGARGGTKSGGGRRCMVLRRFKYPNTKGLILRRTFPQLYRSHIVPLFQEYPKLRYWYNEGKKVLAFPNGSLLFFGSGEHAKDMANFYSDEYADILPDEAQQFSQGEIEDLSAVCRCTTNPDITPKMVFTFMPGVSEDGTPPIGLPYLKRVFVDGDIRGEEKRHQWAFIQAFGWDNIEWARKELGWYKDAFGNWQLSPGGTSEEQFYSWTPAQRREFFISKTEFGADLASITDKDKRDAWLDGSWTVFKGQYFSNFSREKHIRPHAEVMESIKSWHTKWVCFDWGYDHPHCGYWLAMDEKQHVYIYREQWGREMGETELGQRIGQLSAGEKLTQFFFVWDAGKASPRTKTRKSIGQLVTDALPPGVPRPVPADSSPGSRMQRARFFHQFLDAEMLTISDDCKHLIECLPSLVRDPKNTEDVLKVDYSQNGIGDDPYDGASMGLINMLSPPGKPKNVQLEERMKEVRRQMMGSGNQDSKPVHGDPFAKFGGKKL